MSENKNQTSASIKLIGKAEQYEQSNKIPLEITNEGMDYLNNLNSNSIGIISLIGPQNSDKSSFANIIIGDKDAFDDSENTDGIYMWRQPIVHQENEDLLVLDTESLYKQSNINTSYDKQTFILSCLLSSIMVYNTNESLIDCVTKFSNLAKEGLSCLKKLKDKELTPSELPLVYFVFHNINIDSNSAISQFKTIVKDNPIFQKYFTNYKIAILKKAGDLMKTNTISISKGKRIEEIGALDDQDYKQKSKLIKDQIMNHLEPKKINNCNLDGQLLFGLIQSFVDTLNKGENIILIDHFNNVLSSCLTDACDKINYQLSRDQINKELSNNISHEETYLEACKVTFLDCINGQFDKFKSNPIVKISPSLLVFDRIKSIVEKFLKEFCENIQNSINNKTTSINEISKNKYLIPHNLDGQNIEQLLYELSNYINEKILSPLYEPNNNKLQNNEKILEILKSQICEPIEKISPLIQGQINKLNEDQKKMEKKFESFKEKHKNEIEQKSDEINNLKLKTEKQDRLMKEKELENMTLLNIEKEKYNQLEEKYNLEINEKNTYIGELTKNSNPLSTNVEGISSDTNNMEMMPLESLKKDYNDIIDIFVKYKILVTKLINDKDFFFENIVIDKTIGDLQKKHPEIFALLNEKESLENFKTYYEKQIELLKNENLSLKENNMNQDLEINELKKELENNSKLLEDKTSMIEYQQNLIKEKDTFISSYENKVNENNIRLKKLGEENKTLKNLKDSYFKEKTVLDELLVSVFSRKKDRFDVAYKNLNQEYQEKYKNYVKNNYFT